MHHKRSFYQRIWNIDDAGERDPSRPTARTGFAVTRGFMGSGRLVAYPDIILNSDYCRGRDDPYGSPPAQIRTGASTHAALMKNEWRKSGRRGKGAERGVVVSTFRRPERASHTSSSRVDYDEPVRYATVD